MTLKLHEALFREPWRAYQVLTEGWEDEDWENFSEWDLQPLLGPTLAEEDVDDSFEGLFIIAAQIISRDAAPQPCYMDLVLPERIAERHFLQMSGQIRMQNGLRAPNGTVIPSIGIEKLGKYRLFYAKENPAAGIDVLKRGMQEARHEEDLAYDLAYLLRDQKRYEEAIEAFTVVLNNLRMPELIHWVYQERARMYAAIGRMDKAEADKQRYIVAYQKHFGHPPRPQDMDDFFYFGAREK
jgi:tetratricopeptide (TPR) repeat protein